MLGTWKMKYEEYPEYEEYEGEITLRPNGTASVKTASPYIRNQFTLVPSTNETAFPTSQGWVKAEEIYYPDAWAYLRVENGTLIVHLFRKYRSGTFHGLEHFWTTGEGVRSGKLGLLYQVTKVA